MIIAYTPTHRPTPMPLYNRFPIFSQVLWNGNHIVVEMLVNTVELEPSSHVWKDEGYTAATDDYGCMAQYSNGAWTARVHLPPVHLRCHRCNSFLDVVDTNALFYCVECDNNGEVIFDLDFDTEEARPCPYCGGMNTECQYCRGHMSSPHQYLSDTQTIDADLSACNARSLRRGFIRQADIPF